jgi:hypothetical protein
MKLDKAIGELLLTEDQAKPFRHQITKNKCFDARHKWPVILNDEPIKAYPHDGGWKVKGLDGLWWLYITCPKCGYDWALWKLGVRRDFDPTAAAEKVQALKANLPEMRSEEDRRDYLPGPEELSE